MARRFNFLYGEVFPEPEQLLTKAKVLPGTDGRKMSKSYGNIIALSDDPATVRKKVMSMITDPARIRKDDPGHPDVCSVYAFHKVFNEEGIAQTECSCKAGAIGCVQCKRCLADKMESFHTPIYEKRQEILKQPDIVRETLEIGNEKARRVAQETMSDVRKAMKIDW
jgi:tryptophanyl-tRNA synthetase